MGIQLTPEERFEVFGDFDPDEYADEAEERWGGTDAYRESHAGGRRATPRTTGSGSRPRPRTGPAARRGDGRRAQPADSPEAMDLAEEHRAADQPVVLRVLLRDPHRAGRHVRGRRAVHRELDKIRPGLAAYLREAIHANAARA